MISSYRLMSWAPTPAPVATAPRAALLSAPAAPPAAPDTWAISTGAWELQGLQQQVAALTASMAKLEQQAAAPVAPAPTPAPKPAPAPKPKAEPKPKPKPKAESKPKPDADAKYASRLRDNLHGAYWKASIQCFRYAWNVVGKSGGRSIGKATQSRDGRGKSTAYLGQMVREGRIKAGDIVYINKKPGADPTSTILSYKPHWFVYIGKGQFADQFGERDAAAMDRSFAGRKIDTIYRTN